MTGAPSWSLEGTFHEAKGKLGFEDPQNRTERAVERTAPLELISYTLTVLWYIQHGQRTRAASDSAVVHPQGWHDLQRYAGNAAARLLE